MKSAQLICHTSYSIYNESKTDEFGNRIAFFQEGYIYDVIIHEETIQVILNDIVYDIPFSKFYNNWMTVPSSKLEDEIQFMIIKNNPEIYNTKTKLKVNNLLILKKYNNGRQKNIIP